MVTLNSLTLCDELHIKNVESRESFLTILHSYLSVLSKLFWVGLLSSVSKRRLQLKILNHWGQQEGKLIFPRNVSLRSSVCLALSVASCLSSVCLPSFFLYYPRPEHLLAPSHRGVCSSHTQHQRRAARALWWGVGGSRFQFLPDWRLCRKL